MTMRFKSACIAGPDELGVNLMMNRGEYRLTELISGSATWCGIIMVTGDRETGPQPPLKCFAFLCVALFCGFFLHLSLYIFDE
jgi:hypothetical protein